MNKLFKKVAAVMAVSMCLSQVSVGMNIRSYDGDFRYVSRVDAASSGDAEVVTEEQTSEEVKVEDSKKDNESKKESKKDTSENKKKEKKASKDTETLNELSISFDDILFTVQNADGSDFKKGDQLQIKSEKDVDDKNSYKKEYKEKAISSYIEKNGLEAKLRKDVESRFYDVIPFEPSVVHKDGSVTDSTKLKWKIEISRQGLVSGLDSETHKLLVFDFDVEKEANLKSDEDIQIQKNEEKSAYDLEFDSDAKYFALAIVADDIDKIGKDSFSDKEDKKNKSKKNKASAGDADIASEGDAQPADGVLKDGKILAEVAGIKVEVQDVNDVLPEGTSMIVKKLSDSEALDIANEVAGKTVDGVEIAQDAVGVDITFIDSDGNEFEPEDSVSVKIDIEDYRTLEVSDEVKSPGYDLIHVTNDGKSELVEGAEVSDSGASFEAKEFSPYVLAASRAGMNLLAAAPGDYVDYTSHLEAHQIVVDGKVMLGNGSETIDPEKDFGVELQFYLTFEDMVENGLKYSYKLPEHISIGDKGSDSSPLTLYNGSGVAIGTYFIKDDVIYVTYPGYYYDVTTKFNLDASWSDVEGRNEVEVKWEDGVDKFKIDNSDIIAEKESVKYQMVTDSSSPYMCYTEFMVTARTKTKAGAQGVSNIVLEDTMSNTKMVLYEDFYPGNKEFKVVVYDSDDQMVGEPKFYDKSDSDVTVTTTKDGNKTITKFTIKGLSLEQGQHLTVYYAGGIESSQRTTVMAEGDAFRNEAKFGYPYYNPETGKTENIYVSAKDEGYLSKDTEWLYKTVPNQNNIRFDTVGDETRTLAPYSVGLNTGMTEQIGGSSLQDKLSLSKANIDKGYTATYYAYNNDIYNKADYRPTLKTKTLSGEEATHNIEWLIVSQATYDKIAAHHSSSSKVQLDNFAADTALLAAIQNETGVAVNASNAWNYIFTVKDGMEFTWFSPKDTEPTSYTISYWASVDPRISAFTNGASLYFKTIFSTEPGDATPIVVNFATSKHNNGVYKGADDNYYVDYVIQFHMGPNSGGLEDWGLSDWFPSYEVTTASGGTVKVYDWLAGLSQSSLSMQDTEGYSNAAAVESAFDISTDSKDPEVKALVDRLRVGAMDMTWIALKEAPYYDRRNEEITGEMAAFTSKAENLLHNDTTEVYKAGSEAAMAGQFAANADVTGREGNGVRRTISSGDRFSIGGAIFFPGDLPDTLGKDGYTVTIKYTMMINPYLVDRLPSQLEKEGKTQIELNNRIAWFGEYTKYERNLATDAVGTRRTGDLTSAYSIGGALPDDAIDKYMTSPYDSSDDTMGYKIVVNEDGKLVAENQTYHIKDNLSLAGVYYKPGTLEVKDSEGKIIFTEISGHTQNSKYKGLVNFKKTTSDNESNSFDIALDNKSATFTNSTGKLDKLTVTYKIDVKEVVQDITSISNTASLTVEVPESGGVPAHEKIISSSDVKSSIAKALDKVLVAAPSESTQFRAKYKITVDPNSPNAKELKTIVDKITASAPQYFTLEDVFDENLALDLNSVKVYQILDNVSTDITKNCVNSYDSKNRKFSSRVKMTDKNATYRIEYDAIPQGINTNTLATISNKAKIVGTAVSEEKTQDEIYIYQYAGSASATDLRIRLRKYDEADITKKLQATFNLYKYAYTDTKENSANNIRTAEANSADGDWSKIDVKTGSVDGLVTSAETGEVELHNQTIGTSVVREIEYDTWYRLVETEAPDGYMESAPVYYYVMGDGRNKNMIPADAKGKYEIIIPAKNLNDEPPYIFVGNSKLQFSVLKVDQLSMSPLEGAKFAIYSDEGCTKLIKNGTSDSDGLVTFKDLTSVNLPGEVYLKETQAPSEYRANTNIYKVSFNEKGTITSVVNVNDDKDTLDVDTDKARVTFTNASIYTKVSVKKVLEDPDLQKTSEFAFVLNLRDASRNEIKDPVYAEKIDASGVATPVTGGYRSGTIFYLKHGETFSIPKLEGTIRYTASEVEDNAYKTSYRVISTTEEGTTGQDNNLKDGFKTDVVVEKGNESVIEFHNEKKVSLEFKKTVKREDGGDISIPIGHTVIIRNAWDGGNIYAKAKWNGLSYESTYLADDKMVFSTSDKNGNPIEGGFRITNFPINRTSWLYVAEENANIPGYTYKLAGSDNANPNGMWVNVPTWRDRKVNFVNTYVKAEASAEVKASKVMLGRALTADEFRFRLRMKQSEKFEYILAEKTCSANGLVAFDRIDYTLDYLKDSNGVDINSRDMIYMIEEINDSETGVSYDPSRYYVKVTLKRTTDGMTASAPVYYTEDPEVNPSAKPLDGQPVFYNGYSATGRLSLKAGKEVEGGDADNGLFSFTVKEYESDYKTPVNGANGTNVVSEGNCPSVKKDKTEPETVSFGTISYQLESNISEHTTNADKVLGDHYYIVSENIPSDAVDNKKNGWTYDSSEIKIRVSVRDAGAGKLSVTVYDENGKEISEDSFKYSITFKNTYKAEGKANFNLQKILTGRTFNTTDKFTFTVDQIEPINKTIYSEVTSSDIKTVKKKVASATIEGVDNQYYLNAQSTDVKYTQDDIGKKYWYIIREDVPANAVNNKLNGIKYTDHFAIAYVDVIDNKNGTLSSQVNYFGQYNAQFVNEYKAEGNAVFDISKILTGRKLDKSVDNFTFKVDQIDASGSVINENVSTGTMENFDGKADSKITFTPISYGEGDIGKTYYYKITENQPTGGKKDGVTYTADPVKATVSVTDNGNGTLKTTITYDKDIKSFTNKYEAEGSIVLKTEKLLNRMDLKAGMFEYELKENGKVLSTARNAADGSIVFNEIKYDLNDLGQKSYTISEVMPDDNEVSPGVYSYADGTMEYDSTIYTVVVDIKDNKDGTLAVDVTGATKDGREYKVDIPSTLEKSTAFVNTYIADTTVNIDIYKSLLNHAIDDTQKFSFTVTEYTDEDRTTVKKDGENDITYSAEAEKTEKGDAPKRITIPELKYELADEYAEIEKDGKAVHYYRVTEDIPEAAVTSDGKTTYNGTTYDTAGYDFTVTVNYDSDSGVMSADVNYDTETTIKNEYHAEGKATFTGKKVLEGRSIVTDGKNKDVFTFIANRLDDKGSVDVSAIPVLGTVKDSDGNIEFEDIYFTEADVDKTYTYEITEVVPDEVKEKGVKNEDGSYTYKGITYSTESFKAYIKITDNNDGTLNTEVSYGESEALAKSDSNIVFVNKYNAEGKITLTGKKSVENAKKFLGGFDLAEKMFTFTVAEKSDTQEEAVATGYNDAEGNIIFTDITYGLEDIGTHEYVITEDESQKVDGVLNDKSEITVKVTVTDAGDGTLNTEVVYSKEDTEVESAQFTNKATEVNFSKVDEKGKSLKGATIAILDEKGKEIYRYKSGKSVETIYGLKVGVKYIMRELKAPKKYEIADDIEFTIDDDGSILIGKQRTDVIEMVDTKAAVVTGHKETKPAANAKTGDNTMLGLIMIMMMLSLCGIVSIFTYKKRKKDQI
ncbi:MAG: hypothetical protein J6M65_00530 [Eubacterium sp.]|nr:hypothetical protein [Eubacterium sp.]